MPTYKLLLCTVVAAMTSSLVQAMENEITLVGNTFPTQEQIINSMQSPILLDLYLPEQIENKITLGGRVLSAEGIKNNEMRSIALLHFNRKDLFEKNKELCQKIQSGDPEAIEIGYSIFIKDTYKLVEREIEITKEHPEKLIPLVIATLSIHKEIQICFESITKRKSSKIRKARRKFFRPLKNGKIRLCGHTFSLM